MKQHHKKFFELFKGVAGNSKLRKKKEKEKKKEPKDTRKTIILSVERQTNSKIFL